MAHAIFNVSPVKFLSSIQDHVFTVTPTFKNKTYKTEKRKSYPPQEENTRQSSSSASPVTLQLTLPTESLDNQMIQQEQQSAYEPLSPSAVPIDIPRSYPTPNMQINTNYDGKYSLY